MHLKPLDTAVQLLAARNTDTGAPARAALPPVSPAPRPNQTAAATVQPHGAQHASATHQASKAPVGRQRRSSTGYADAGRTSRPQVPDQLDDALHGTVLHASGGRTRSVIQPRSPTAAATAAVVDTGGRGQQGPDKGGRFSYAGVPGGGPERTGSSALSGVPPAAAAAVNSAMTAGSSNISRAASGTLESVGPQQAGGGKHATQQHHYHHAPHSPQPVAHVDVGQLLLREVSRMQVGTVGILCPSLEGSPCFTHAQLRGADSSLLANGCSGQVLRNRPRAVVVVVMPARHCGWLWGKAFTARVPTPTQLQVEVLPLWQRVAELFPPLAWAHDAQVAARQRYCDVISQVRTAGRGRPCSTP